MYDDLLLALILLIGVIILNRKMIFPGKDDRK